MFSVICFRNECQARAACLRSQESIYTCSLTTCLRFTEIISLLPNLVKILWRQPLPQTCFCQLRWIPNSSMSCRFYPGRRAYLFCLPFVLDRVKRDTLSGCWINLLKLEAAWDWARDDRMGHVRLTWWRTVAMIFFFVWISLYESFWKHGEINARISRKGCSISCLQKVHFLSTFIEKNSNYC